MRFWQAMKIVDEGGKVRRKGWVDLDRYVQKMADGIVDVVDDETSYPLHDFMDEGDIEAEDWEVVDPAPTGREEVMLPNELKLYNENIDGF